VLTLREAHGLRVFENVAEEDVWTYEGESNRRIEEIA
jgi:hypothetical protein